MKLLSELGRKRKQHVARYTVLKANVSRANEHHPIRDGRSASSDRTALGSDVVGRLKLLGGVELPDGASVHRGYGAQNAVHAPREEDSGNDADGCDDPFVSSHGLGILQGTEPLLHTGGEI